MLRYKLERLQDQKNIFWKQRAHAHWLKDGDQNTKYFHACVCERKRENMIKKLKTDSGGVVEGDENLKMFIENHHKTLFSSGATHSQSDLFVKVSIVVSGEMNYFFTKAFTNEEIK